jgi:transcriptional regulator with XRE-family HTH domain
MQRRLTRSDFPGIDPKTLARIESNSSMKPHAATLRMIAERLGVAVDDLGSY